MGGLVLVCKHDNDVKDKARVPANPTQVVMVTQGVYLLLPPFLLPPFLLPPSLLPRSLHTGVGTLAVLPLESCGRFTSFPHISAHSGKTQPIDHKSAKTLN